MKNKNSTQNLFGLRTFGKYGLLTDKAGFAFFSVQPTNISVLSAENIDVKIHHLMMLLSMIPELEIICLDSCECFDGNKVHIKNRLKQEENPHIRKLLEQDMAFLDDIQVEMSTARQFLFCIRFKDKKDEQYGQIFYGSFYLRQQPQMRVGSSGMAAYYGGTSDSGAPCGQEFCDAPYLQPPCGQLRAAADYTACHTPEQADVHNKRCDGIPGCGEQFAGRGAAYCRPET